MKKLKYIGRYSGVDMSGIGTVMRGETVEVPDDIAEMLLERQSEWELAHKEKAIKKQEAN